MPLGLIGVNLQSNVSLADGGKANAMSTSSNGEATLTQRGNRPQTFISETELFCEMIT